MNQIKTKRKGKASYTKKINTNVPSWGRADNTFAYGDVVDTLKMYSGKDCIEKFAEYIKDETKQLQTTLSQQQMIELTDVLKREYKKPEKYHLFKVVY